MKVKELIEILKTQNQELEVWASKDSEGNNFRILSGDVSEGWRINDEGDIFIESVIWDAEDDIEDWYKVEENECTKILVLWPI